MAKKVTRHDVVHNTKFYANLFNITVRRIQQLAKDGIIPKSGRGRYPLIGAVKGYVGYLQTLRLSNEPIVPSDKDLDPVQEKARLDRERRIYQAVVTEMKLGELIPIELIGFVMARVGAEIAAILESLPAKVKKNYPKMTAAQVNVIKKEIAKARNSVVNIHERVDEFIDEFELKTK